MWRLFLVLLTATAYAQPVVHTPEVYTQCKEVPTPAGFLPPTGEQVVYCKSGGAGWCSMNNVGVETCTGGSGGGGGVTAVSCGTGLTCTPASITATGSVALTTPVAFGNGGTGLSTAANNTTLVSNGSLWTNPTIPDCHANNDALTFTQGSNLFSCNTSIIAFSASSVPFSGITTATNTTATMTVGTGASLTTSGSGTIAATSVPASGITGTITDSQLVGPYSGTGPCGANTFASTLNRNASPTCTQPAIGGLLGKLPLLNATLFNDTAAGSVAQGDLIIGNATPAWSVLGPGAANTALTANGTTESFTTINDLTLANAYSGAGTCSPGFPRTFNRNAAPTCAQVNLNSGSTDIIGTLSHGNGGTDQSVASANQVLVGNGTNWIKSFVPSSYAPVKYSGFATGFSTENNWIYVPDFVQCGGATDATSGWASIVSSINTNANFGTSTIYIPSGCKIRFKNPGANNAAGFLPNNTHIICDDESAGFYVDTQTCHGGTYNGAACNASSECLGGGTCEDDFFNAAPGNPSTTTTPCNSTTCFATTGGSTYTVLRDQGVGANDIWIENCSFFLGQASPYQTCSVGGTPCRQECDNAASAGSYPGERCETNADCNGGGAGAGTCLRTPDCHAGGGTCGGVNAAKVPSGPGQIRAIDAPNTTRMQLKHVSVFDGLTADYVVKTGPNALIQNTDITRELTDCTSPITATPSNSACFGAGSTAGTCCYGAGYASNGISSGNKFNTQPANAATQGLVVGANSQVIAFTRARGINAAFVGNGTSTRFDETVVVPFQFISGNPPSNGDNLGPGGLSTVGWLVGDHAQVTKSFALHLCGNGFGIEFANGDAGAVGDKLSFDSTCGTGGVGVQSVGNNNHIIGMNIKGISGTGQAVFVLGNNTTLDSSYLEGGGTDALVFAGSGKCTGAGTPFNCCTASGQGTCGTNFIMTGNNLSSNPINTQSQGATLSGPNDSMNSNTFTNMKDCSMQWGGITVSNFQAVGNMSTMQLLGSPFSLTTLYATPTFHPTHFCLSDFLSNNKVFGQNILYGGVHGIFQNSHSSSGLTQMGAHGNRFLGLAGQPFTWGANAGINEVGNYINSNSAGWTTSCDPSCTSQPGGQPCNQDSDCTTCTSTNKCVPDAYFTDVGSQHFSTFANLFFQSTQAPKQCTVAGPIGQICDVAAANGTCNGGALCAVTQTGGPFICQSGSEVGKRCCQTAAGATCGFRQSTPGIRFDDQGSGPSAKTAMITGNQIFNLGGGSGQGNINAIDMTNCPGCTHTGSIVDSKISDNVFEIIPGASTATIIGINLPTAFTSISHLSLTNNNFSTLQTPASTNWIANYLGSMGSLVMEEGRMASGYFQSSTLNATQTIFFPVNGSALGAPAANTTVKDVFIDTGTFWKSTCTCDASCTANSTRVFTLEQNGNPTAETCTITCPGTTCTTNAIAPLAFTPGQSFDWKMVQTIGTGTLAVANCTCTTYLSHDTAM